MWRFFKPVAIKAAQTLLRAGSEAIKEGATVEDVIKSTVQPTVGAVLGATVDQVASKLIEMRETHDAAPQPNSPIVLPEIVLAGSGRKCRRRLYIRRLPNVSSIPLTSIQLFIIFEMATMGSDVTEEITSEVDVFCSIMQQNIIENKFNHEYAPLATIQHGAPIEFMVKGSNDLYLDLNNSRLHVLAKIINADGMSIGANTAGPINLPLHSISRDFRGVERSKCERHERALSVSRLIGDSAELQKDDPILSSPVQGLDERQFRKHGCHRSRRG